MYSSHWAQPFSPDAASDTATGSLDIVARLRPDATVEQGRRELDAFLDREYARWRTSIGKFEATARTLPTLIVGGVKPAVVMLSMAAGLVLFISCMNVANLLLVRGVTRSREVAQRPGSAPGRDSAAGPYNTRQIPASSTTMRTPAPNASIGVRPNPSYSERKTNADAVA